MYTNKTQIALKQPETFTLNIPFYYVPSFGSEGRTGIILTSFLEAQLLCNYMDVTDSLFHGRLTFSVISPLFVDRFGHSLRFFRIEFDKQAISEGCMSKNA